MVCTRQLLRDTRAIAAAAVEDDYLYLRDQGVVSLVDPKPFLTEHDALITANVAADITNDAFLDAAVAHRADAWNILSERLPPSLLEIFNMHPTGYLESISLQDYIRAKGKIADMAPENRSFAEMEWKQMSPEALPGPEVRWPDPRCQRPRRRSETVA